MNAAVHMRESVERVRRSHAPDPRTAVFEVEVEVRGEVLVLSGATSESAAAEALHAEAAALPAGVKIRDELVRLPESGGDEGMHALITAAVAPMLAGPRVNETQVSQVILGASLLVLRRSRRWLQCRSADGYIGWVHGGYLALLDETDARSWEIGTSGELWISLGAEMLDGSGSPVARLPWGARVVRESEGRIRLPDGRTGAPSGEMIPAARRSERFPLTGEAVVESARRWMGVPYLWGGLTTGGVDCSGLVQAVFGMHGLRLPRDSDQQSRTGDPIDPGPRFEALAPGDLLFFAEDGTRTSHVVIATGAGGIIHASLGNGGVAENLITGRRRYEQELRRIYTGARRVITP